MRGGQYLKLTYRQSNDEGQLKLLSSCKTDMANTLVSRQGLKCGRKLNPESQRAVCVKDDPVNFPLYDKTWADFKIFSYQQTQS